MSERQDIHVHVEEDGPVRRDELAAEESARATSFFTSQLLWFLLIALIIVLIVSALGTGVVDLGGPSGAVEPTAAP